jgi:hypothetical protein
MSYELQTGAGATEAVIDDNCSMSKFYAIADKMTEDLRIKFENQTDNADSLYWDFRYKGQDLTLRYDMFNGVSICPQEEESSPKKNNVIRSIAFFLEHSSF